MEENPSLKSQLRELLARAYRDTLAQVVGETNLPEKSFPSSCPWSLEQMLDEAFWPER